MKKIIMHESLREKYSINRGYAKLKKEMRVAEARYYRCVPCMAAVRKAILDTRIRHKKLTENENLNIARYDKILSWINMINTFQDTAIRVKQTEQSFSFNITFITPKNIQYSFVTHSVTFS